MSSSSSSSSSSWSRGFIALNGFVDYCLERKSDLIRLQGQGKASTKDNAFMQELARRFPREQIGADCSGVGACLKLLLGRHVKSISEGKEIFPKIKILIPYLYNVANSGSATQNNQFKKIFEGQKQLFELAGSIFKRTQLEAQYDSERAFRVILGKITGNVPTFTDKYVFSVISKLKMGSIQERFCALQLSCGARQIELLSHKFKFERSQYDGNIVQIGTAKGKRKARQKKRARDQAEVDEEEEDVAEEEEDDDENGSDENYEPDMALRMNKPVMGISVDEFFVLLKAVRAWTLPDNDKGLTNKQLSSKYNQQLGEVVKRPTVFGPSKPGQRLSTHFNRAVYAQLSFLLIGGPSGYAVSSWFYEKLGHQTTSSVRNYEVVRIVREIVPLVPQDVATKALQESDRKQQEELAELRLKIQTLEAKEEKKDGESPVRKGWSLFATQDVPPQWIWLQKRPRTRGNDLDDFQEIVDWGELTLTNNNIKITNQNLRKLGIGSRATNVLRTDSQCGQMPWTNRSRCPPVIVNP